MAVGEHGFEFAANKPTTDPLPNHSQGNRIRDLILQQRSTLTIVEEVMAVIPIGEWS